MKITTLPGKIDMVLQDLAQTFKTEEGLSINYNDMIAFQNKASKEEVNEAMDLSIIILDYGLDTDNEPEAYEAACKLVKLIKEES